MSKLDKKYNHSLNVEIKLENEKDHIFDENVKLRKKNEEMSMQIEKMKIQNIGTVDSAV
jgi:hypothetical protein